MVAFVLLMLEVAYKLGSKGGSGLEEDTELSFKEKKLVLRCPCCGMMVSGRTIMTKKGRG